jgi:two-component system nitrate/nitrite response regulator NarL
MYKYIFIIDDSDIDAFIIRRLLKMKGYPENSIKTFAYARTALAYFSEWSLNKTTMALPDLIFLDINMADMSGLEFLEKFHHLSAEITDYTKIIVISSSDDPEDISESNSYINVINYIKKPLDEVSFIF